jgi:hypothetical protein
MLHKWINYGTFQSLLKENRYTRYHCSECLKEFDHFYHLEDIYQAMKKHQISNTCKRK